jgi:hypothetical protein
MRRLPSSPPRLLSTSHSTLPLPLPLTPSPCFPVTADHLRGPVGSDQIRSGREEQPIDWAVCEDVTLPAEGFHPCRARTGLIRGDRLHPRGGEFGVGQKAWQGGSRHSWPCPALPRHGACHSNIGCSGEDGRGRRELS